MSRKSKRGLIAVLLLSLAALAIVRPSARDLGFGGASARRSAPVGTFAQLVDVSRFQRGNMHTHTTMSDGRDTPRAVATWYREHGYQFLAITDHDRVDDLADLADLEGGGFVLLPAEEITNAAGDDNAPVHVNGICIEHDVKSGRYDDAPAALAQGIAAIRGQHGFAIVNHPNFRWGLSVSDIATVSGPYALEIWSGHPEVHNLGNGLHPSHERMWDELLARGREVTAVAIDDMHWLAPEQDAPHEPLPGRGWVYTFGAETSRSAICDALVASRLYASSGVELRRIVVSAKSMTVWVDDARAVVDFIGNGGRTLASSHVAPAEIDGDGNWATYPLRGGEDYVRARISIDGVGAAWTQAYRVGR
jgi:hypothetical protein